MTGRPVKLVDRAGRVHFEGTDQAPGGGSQPVKVVRVPFAFDTPGLVADAGSASTGIPIYTPNVGDIILAQFVSVTEAWDGTTPAINWTLTDLEATVTSASLAQADDVVANWPTLLGIPAQGDGGQSPFSFIGVAPPLIALSPGPLRAVVDDGAGGDPGSAQGAAEFVALVIPA